MIHYPEFYIFETTKQFILTLQTTPAMMNIKTLMIAQYMVICFCVSGPLVAQMSYETGFPSRGTLILTGGSFTKEGMKAFVDAAGGINAGFIFVPSASSGIKLPSGYIWEPKDSTSQKIDSFETELAKMFGVKKITVLHTTSRTIADSKTFCAFLKKANAVWLGPGNAGRYASVFLGTVFQKELDSLLWRGGVIGGNSAGSIIQASYIVRGRPDKPVLMARGNEAGFGFLKDVVINPHLISAKREGELVNVLDMHPELIGIGVDDEITLIVSNGIVETKGSGPIYIYDNQLHDKKWWYELPVGKKFSLKERRIIESVK
jgi:cyanophycinase